MTTSAPLWALAFLTSLVTLVPRMPFNGRVPGMDSGVFLYAGWRILAGEPLYTGVWDHKPPLIFFVNAAGIFLGGGSEWGVWALELACLTATVYLLGRLIADEFGRPAAAAAVVLFAAGLNLVVENGNFCEVYGLFFQALFLRLASTGGGGARAPRANGNDARGTARGEDGGARAPRANGDDARGTARGEDGGARAAALGAAAAALFGLKQNLIALPAAWVLLTVWTRRKAAPAVLLAAAAGFAAALFPFAAYLAYHGALAEAWDAAFVFNAVNRTQGPGALLASVLEGLRLLLGSGLPLAAAAGAALGLREVLGGRALPAATALAMAALPLELAFAAASGRQYQHYYLPWLPVFSVLSGAALRRLVERGPVLAALLVAAALIAPGGLWWEYALRARLAASGIDPIVKAVRARSPEGSTVLFWGTAARFNFASGRPAPTRFVNQFPLYRRGHRGDEYAAELLESLRARPPRLIVDMSPLDPGIPPLDPASDPDWSPPPDRELPPRLAALRAHIQGNYVRIGRLGRFAFYAPPR